MDQGSAPLGVTYLATVPKVPTNPTCFCRCRSRCCFVFCRGKQPKTPVAVIGIILTSTDTSYIILDRLFVKCYI